MPGKRLRDPALTRTSFTEAVSKGAEVLTDWDGLVWARPIAVELLGNSWMQGSYDGVTWADIVQNDHTYIRLSTNGGVTWRIITLDASGESHEPITIGNPDGGLDVDENQVLILNPATTTNAGSLSPGDKLRIDSINWYYVNNLGAGAFIYDGLLQVGDDVTFNLKSLVAGNNVSLVENADSIEIHATATGTGGVDNLGRNIGDAGYGVVESNESPYINLRNLAAAVGETALTLSLDATKNIRFGITQENIDHDILSNYEANEHVNHANVEIATEEGITGGGDLTVTRTLSLAFDELDSVTNVGTSDIFSIYNIANDLHYSISYGSIRDGLKTYNDTLYTPLARKINTGIGLTGGGDLSQDRTLSLSINGLSTIPLDGADFVAVYDTSGGTHAKVLLSELIGNLSVELNAGSGMYFNQITGVGDISMGTPSTVNQASVNGFVNNLDILDSHTHALVIDNLTYIGDVTNTPTSGQYLKWNGSTWVTDNPAVGSTTPGGPNLSVQFNNSNVFDGNSGLLYNPVTDTLQFTDINNGSGILFYLGSDVTDPYIQTSRGTNEGLLISNYNNLGDYINLLSNRLMLGNAPASGDYFLGLIDPNTANPFTYTLKIQDVSNENIFLLSQQGDLYLPKLSSATADSVLYYDSATGLITSGAAPSGGGGANITINTGSTSGLTVNGGNTSAAAVMNLAQNDFKLTDAVPESSDYLGFWDVSEGVQSKMQIGQLPGWNVYVDGVLGEEIKIGNNLNFQALSDDIQIDYDEPSNSVNFTVQVAKFPTYTHNPMSIISIANKLYTYDILSGTAVLLPNAPVSTYSRDLSIGNGKYIFTTNGNTLHRYDIENDISVSASTAGIVIFKILYHNGIIYCLSENACYYIDAELMDSFTYYGNHRTEANDFKAAEILYRNTDAASYIVISNADEDRYTYKEVVGGAAAAPDDFTASGGGRAHDAHAFITLSNNTVAINGDNESRFYTNFDDTVSDNNPTLLATYNTPSGHGWGGDGEITTLKAYPPVPTGTSTIPTSYTITDTSPSGTYSQSEAYVDRGVYVATTNNSPFQNLGFNQVTGQGEKFSDLYVDYSELTSLVGVNVIAGTENSRIYFHSSDEDPGQFTYNTVTVITDSNLQQAQVSTAPVAFVYYHSQYTASNLDPKDPTGFKYLDLYLDSVLVEQGTTELDFIAGNNIQLTYGLNGKVTISSIGDAVNTVNSQYSITGDGSVGSPLQLTGDVDTPGVSKYYGTDINGTKGYYDLPTVNYNFLDLSDSPSDYTGHGGKLVAVKATEDGVEFITVDTSVSLHASTHIQGGSDEIDGDKLDIDFTPTNYTPSVTPVEVDNVDQLSAHLYGIDQAIGSIVVVDQLNALNDVVITTAATNNLLAYNGANWVNSTAASLGLATTSALNNYQPLDGDLTAIAALAGTTGLLRKTAANTWQLDTNTYLTSVTASDVAIVDAGGDFTATNVEDALAELKQDIADTASAAVQEITLSAAQVVTDRITGATFPAGWSLAQGTGNYDLVITHNTGRRAYLVTVFYIEGGEEIQLYDSAAFGTMRTTTNTVTINSLGTIPKQLKLYIAFV